jgi:hypothetical protein
MGKASIDFSDPGILGKACDERLSVGWSSAASILNGLFVIVWTSLKSQLTLYLSFMELWDLPLKRPLSLNNLWP